MAQPKPGDDASWMPWKNQWQLRADTVYLNHGSFGPPPKVVQQARRRWIERLDQQPMDFFVRQLSAAISATRETLGRFIGADAQDLVLTDNATAAMNVLADSLPLRSTDEVVLTQHAYGAVQRIWQRACRRAGARPPRLARLPLPLQSQEQIVEAIFAEVTQQTRLIVVSHITSATAIIMPVHRICRLARQRGVPVCVDGPHALAQVPLQLDELPCDYYTASCHKWLSAAFGSGFLYVTRSRQDGVEPQVLSYGTMPPTEPRSWSDRFLWSGTRDPSAVLTIPTAIELLESLGLEAFRERTHALARYARRQLIELAGEAAMVPDSQQWYGSMTCVPLPPGDTLPLQRALWEQFGIEVPVIDFGGQRLIRVSCHLYNTRADIDRLVAALSQLLNL